MEIHEEENENNSKFKIKTVKYNSDGTDDNVLFPLPSGASNMVFIGRPKSGKTTVALNFLTRRAYYLKRFNKIFVFSPSIMVSLDEDHMLHELPPEQLHTELNATNLQEAIDSIYNSNKRVLFLFDDVYSDFTGEVLKKVWKLCNNRRHLSKKGISIWICAQTFPQIPLKIRKTISDLFLFQTTNEREIEAIRKEYCNAVSEDDFHDLLDYVFDVPHNYLYIKTNHQIEDTFYKNLNPLNVTLKKKREK